VGGPRRELAGRPAVAPRRRAAGSATSGWDVSAEAATLALAKLIERYLPLAIPSRAFAELTILGELRRHFRDATWDVRPPPSRRIRRRSEQSETRNASQGARARD
jgi:hypothetical protein